MRRKKSTLLGGILLAAVLVGVPIMAACAPAAEVPTEVPELQQELTAERAKVSGLESEISGLESKIAELEAPPKVYEWRFQTFIASAESAYPFIEQMCDDIREMSGGRLDITPYPGGTIVPSWTLFAALEKGTIEMGEVPDSYFEDVVPIAAMPDGAGLLPPIENYAQWESFFQYSGVAELIREAYAEYNVYWLRLAGRGTSYGDGFSRVPIWNLSDYKGLKVRCIGLISDIWEHFGATAVYFPGEEMYTALATGTVDVVLWAGPEAINGFGFQEVAKYYLNTPATLASCNSMLLNMDAWNELPDDLKLILDRAVHDYSEDYLTYCLMQSAEVLKEWQEEYGVTICTLPEDEVKEMQEEIMSFWPEKAARGTRIAEGIDLLNDFMKSQGIID